MQLNYDEIRRIHRLEKNTSNLVEVEPDFYNQLHAFVEEEKASYLESLKDFSTGKAKEFNNLKKMIEEIFAMRAKKILNKSLIASRTSETSEQHMASEEKEIYRNMVKLLNEHNSLLQSLFSNEAGSAKGSGNALNNVKLKVIGEIPSFVGPDMKEYGPYGKEQVVELPFKIAKLLESRNLCEVKV